MLMQEILPAKTTFLAGGFYSLISLRTLLWWIRGVLNYTDYPLDGAYFFNFCKKLMPLKPTFLAVVSCI